MSNQPLWPPDKRSWRRIVWRRLWLLFLCPALASAGALAVVSQTHTTYQTEALFVVVSGADDEGPGQAYEAQRLAVTFVDLLPEDATLRAEISARTGLSDDDVRGAFTAGAIPDTALFRARFETSNPEAAQGAIAVVVEAVSGDFNLPTIPRGAVTLVDLDADPAESGRTATPIVLAVALGLMLGIVLVFVAERADPRIDDRQSAASLVGDRVIDLSALPAIATGPALQAWMPSTGGDSAPTRPRIALVPVGQHGARGAAVVLERIRASADALEADGISLADVTIAEGPMTPDGAMDILTSTTVAVVAARGVRLRNLAPILRGVRQLGVEPGGLVLVERRLRPTNVDAKQPTDDSAGSDDAIEAASRESEERSKGAPRP